MRSRSPRWLRRLLIAGAIVIAVLALIRIFVDPVAAHFTRKALAEADGIRGDFLSVHVTVFPPASVARLATAQTSIGRVVRAGSSSSVSGISRTIE